MDYMTLRNRARRWLTKSAVIEETLRLAMAGQGVPGQLAQNPSAAVGVPAVLQGYRLITETAARMPTIVYTESADGVRQRATTSWQYERLCRRPASNGVYTPVDWRSDMYASLVGFGNAYSLKFKSVTRGEQVTALQVLDPRTVYAEWDGLDIVYTVSDPRHPENSGRQYTRDDILHVRGMTLHGEAMGMSPITACRLALGTGLTIEEFVNAFYTNDARPGGIILVPGKLTREQAADMLELWEEQHAGAGKKGRTAILGGGMDWKQLGMNFTDAQFVESQRLSVEQVARILGMPAPLLGIGEAKDAHWRALLKFTVGAYTDRMDAALTADMTFFPPGSAMYAESLAENLLRPDGLDRYEMYRRARQAGWLTANEIRRAENYPPVEGGDEIQATPVGGAPNGDPPPADTPPANDGETP